MRIGLVTAKAAAGLDEDELPLRTAVEAAGHAARVVAWDDPAADWAALDVALLRSTWDYTDRLADFLGWAARISRLTTLLNPPALVQWNTDKHYLAALAGAGVPIVPSTFVEPGDDVGLALTRFVSAHATDELVVKPAVGAGARDTERHRTEPRDTAMAHSRRLLAAGRSVLLQPYLNRVDEDGETALIYYSGRFSHAIRKGPLLPAQGAATATLFAPEDISPRTPTAEELEVADRVLAAIPFGAPLYARVDLIRDDTGAPRLLELELTEPSLFFKHAPGAAARLVAALDDYVRGASRSR